MKIGDKVLIKGIVDEIRKDVVIIKNDGGYFGTVASEIIDKYAEQEPCDDVVRRQAVLEIIDDEWLCNAEYEFRPLVEAIEKLPSVRPQPKTGHWIMDRQLERRTCNNCNTEYRWSFYPHNFCPNCGCSMYEPQESEDKE